MKTETMKTTYLLVICCIVLGAFIGTCIGAVWQRSIDQIECTKQYGYFINDSHVWVEFENKTNCFSKINCQDMIFNTIDVHHTKFNIGK